MTLHSVLLNPAKILVVDDDLNMRRAMQTILRNENYEVTVCDSPLSAFRELQSTTFDLGLFDIRMGELSGLDLYRKIRENNHTFPVIFVSGQGSMTESAQAVQLGAFDFLEKPLSNEKLLISVKRCLEMEILKRKLEDPFLDKSSSEFSILGDSKQNQKLLSVIRTVGPSESVALIQGESGTGKELVARMIHAYSKRSNGPLVRVNCSSIPENLIESELFGYEKGAFTGAQQSKRGFFEQAHRGTLFLDEIGDMSLQAQAKVLRAIQNSEIQKLGSEKVLPINVRLIAATHKNLEEEVKAGRFREDLFYRINVVPLHTTPLRERPEDIGLLASVFMKRICEKNGFAPKSIDSNVISVFQNHRWPGNVRELQNVIERIAIFCSGTTVSLQDLPQGYFNATSENPSSTSSKTRKPLKEYRDQLERDYIVRALKETDGNISQASEMLDIDRTYLHKKIQQYNIQKKEYY